MNASEARAKLRSVGQNQVLHFFDQLSPAEQARLLAQIESLDLDHIHQLAEEQVKKKIPLPLPKDIQPVQPYPRVPDAQRQPQYNDAHKRGFDLLKQGKVAAFLVAGGQGTRLGYEGPKGEFPITPIKQKPLFQVFAEQLLAWSRDAARVIPWYIMTSDSN